MPPGRRPAPPWGPDVEAAPSHGARAVPPGALQVLAERLDGVLTVHRQYPLGRQTSFQIGGEADLYVEPDTEEQVAAVMAAANAPVAAATDKLPQPAPTPA